MRVEVRGTIRVTDRVRDRVRARGRVRVRARLRGRSGLNTTSPNALLATLWLRRRRSIDG